MTNSSLSTLLVTSVPMKTARGCVQSKNCRRLSSGKGFCTRSAYTVDYLITHSVRPHPSPMHYEIYAPTDMSHGVIIVTHQPSVTSQIKSDAWQYPTGQFLVYANAQIE